MGVGVMKKFRVFLLSVLFLGLTACTKCTSGPQNPTSNAKGSNDQLILAMAQEFESLNPVIYQMLATSYIHGFTNRATNSINKDWKWECAVCVTIPTLENGLTKIIEEGGKKKVVSSWEIKPEAKWGDGVDVTGKDFELAWEVGSSDKVAVGEKDNYTRIEKVEIDPENPKKFTLTHDNAYYDYYKLANNSVSLLPAHLERAIWEKTKNETGSYEKQTNYSTNPLNPGLYNGPYVVSELKLASHVVLTPSKHFYGQQPKIQKIILKLIPNTQTMEANLFAGNVDALSILALTFDQALILEKKIKADPSLASRFQVKFREGLVYEHIDLNLKRNKILQDLRVRKALMHSLDRNKLTTALFEGKQKPALHNIHPLDVYYTEDVAKYPHSLEKAGALLDEAGWELGKDGYRYKDGKKLTLSLMTTAQNKTRELVQVFLQSEWKKVGMDIVLKTEPARVYFGETVRKAKFPAMAMFAWISSPDNPPKSILHSSMIPTKANGFSGQNSAGWVNKEVDAAFDAIQLEFDVEKRKSLMKTVLQAYKAEIPVIPLYLRSDVAVIPTALKNFNLTGHQFSDSGWSEYWTLED